MADFDLVVVGGGTGNKMAAAADAGLETALVEPGPHRWDRSQPRL